MLRRLFPVLFISILLFAIFGFFSELIFDPTTLLWKLALMAIIFGLVYLGIRLYLQRKPLQKEYSRFRMAARKSAKRYNNKKSSTLKHNRKTTNIRKHNLSDPQRPKLKVIEGNKGKKRNRA